MSKKVKLFWAVLVGSVSLIAGVLSILQSLGYLKAFKRAIGLP